MRRRFQLTGTVQGVGFRPFVFRRATELGLSGSVRNDATGVVIEAEGDPASLSAFRRSLLSDCPPLARVESLVEADLPPGETPAGFVILESARGLPGTAAVSVDVATCEDCRRELFDPADRRYRYPFINCTNCGPRYTITRSVPYDRSSTTMAGFLMCSSCRREYDDPLDRRFHAQPNACARCGPRLAFVGGAEEVAEREDALSAAVRLLAGGGIVAVKGIGGYHLAVDALADGAICELRRRKGRDAKPFAVMVGRLEDARRMAILSPAAEEALTSPRRPIVLVPRRESGSLAEAVAPGLSEIGLMLPYTPLHHLLLADFDRPLVMTSGNVSDEPIAFEDEEALSRLRPLVDGFLTHDRPIHVRCDDSVVRAGVVSAAPQMIRRARGYVPEPLVLSRSATRPVLAVGAELKSTLSLLAGRALTTSHHLGDLGHLAAFHSFLREADRFPRLCGVSPEYVAHDLHPDYLSTKWALESGMEPVAVQHHHAHIASLLAEADHPGAVIGVAFDGLGWGPNGTLWGGEFLHADLSGFRRLGHLKTVPLPGGDRAVREPWRMALSFAEAAGGRTLAAAIGQLLDPRHEQLLGVLQSPLSPHTSSAGRLFDAVAAVLGLRLFASYEGQAAIELEAAARRSEHRGRALPAFLRGEEDGCVVLDPAPAIGALVEGRLHGAAAEPEAFSFHASLASEAARLAAELAEREGEDTVALSGGVFQNRLLTELVVEELGRRGLRVLVHRQVPPNDGGISVGQAAVAALGGTIS